MCYQEEEVILIIALQDLYQHKLKAKTGISQERNHCLQYEKCIMYSKIYTLYIIKCKESKFSNSYTGFLTCGECCYIKLVRILDVINIYLNY
jgi:hypothetical protein